MENNKKIGFFSSDARDLYIEDVYRALALPEKSIIHFRYDQKYISESIVTSLKQTEGSGGIIYFVSGNKVGVENQIKEYHSIRYVTVKCVEKSDSTA